MDSDGERPRGARGYVQFSAKVSREVCVRIAAGETQGAINADPAMPSRATIGRWARERPAFAKVLARAKALARREGVGPNSTWCPVVAHEIVARLAEGETLTAIAEDPAMPSMGTMFYWRNAKPEFAEAMRLAREAVAERFSDLGWRMAMEATPETAHLTRVRLAQLRWTAAVLGPRTHGRLKPTEPPEPPRVTTICFRHFRIEENAEGQHRVVGFTPDPDTLLPARTSEGDWKDPVDPVAKAAGLRMLIEESWPPRVRPAGPPPDDPEGWC
jgi:hypothetical protein